MNKKRIIRFSGFTLAEAMLAVVILGMAAAGVLVPFTSGEAVRIEGMRRSLAATLCSALMEELINTPFDDLVNGYNGYSEDKGSIKDAGGTIFTDAVYANYSRDVTIQHPYKGSDRLILATVRVYYNGRVIASLRRLIGRR